MIENLENDIYVSIVSWFEITIKINIGKLRLPESLDATFEKSEKNLISTLHISQSQLSVYLGLPMPGKHRDPFDRLIISAALTENIPVISADPKFLAYADLVRIIW